YALRCDRPSAVHGDRPGALPRRLLLHLHAGLARARARDDLAASVDRSQGLLRTGRQARVAPGLRQLPAGQVALFRRERRLRGHRPGQGNLRDRQGPPADPVPEHDLRPTRRPTFDLQPRQRAEASVNRQITKLAVASLILLTALIVATTYWQTWASAGLAAKQDNAIQRVAQFRIKRGLIRAADGTI